MPAGAVLKTAFLLWFTSFFWWKRGLQENSKPNILFILVDDLGFNDVGYHAKDHGSLIRTPFIDELAEGGIKLENYYVHPTCTPSRGALLTGRYNSHIGLHHKIIRPNQAHALPLQYELLPESLKKCGYNTHMVGKWHLGRYKSEFLPWNRGFDTFAGILTGGADYFTRYRCFHHRCGYDWFTQDGPSNDTFGEYATHLLTRKAMEAVSNGDPTKPFFLYLAYTAPHPPIQVPVEYEMQYSHIKDETRRIYAGMVAALDESIRNVTTYLKQSGQLDNTIMVFSTDNGGDPGPGGNNWPLRGKKGSIYEGGIRAVGFVHGKRLPVKNVTYNGLLHIADWFPTLLRAVDCPVDDMAPQFNGVDQWDAILNLSKPPREELLHMLDPLWKGAGKLRFHESIPFDTTARAAMRKGPWKLHTGISGIGDHFKPPEQVLPPENRVKLASNGLVKGIKLFNIEEDPYELQDVSHLHPEVVKELLRRMIYYNTTSSPATYPPFDKNFYPEKYGGFWIPWLD